MEEQDNSLKSCTANKNARVLFTSVVVFLLCSAVYLSSVLEKAYLFVSAYILSSISILYFYHLFFCREKSKLLKQFRVKEEVWEKTVNAMNDIITVQDKEMRIIQANQAAHNAFKELHGGLLGKKCYEVFRGSNEPCPQCPGLASLKGVQNHSEVITHQNLGKTFMVSSSPIIGDTNEVEYIVHIARDITEQEHMEEEQVMFNAIVTHSNDSIYVVDTETGEFRFTNKKGYTGLGYEEDELKKLRVHDIGQNIHSHQDWINHVAYLKKHGSRLFETQQRRKDNTLFPVEVNARIVEYKNQDVLVSVVRDISERKIAEEKLFVEKSKLGAVVAAMGDGLTVQDRNFVILYQNEAHKKKQGAHRGEFCYEAYHGRKSVCNGCLLERCYRDGEVHRREISLETEAGVTYLEVSASPIKDASGKIIRGIETVRDITERKRLESQVAQAQRMEAIGNLAGGIAHDFNNILTAVVGYSQLTKFELNSLGLSEYNIDQVITAGNRATELVKQILAVSRKTEHKLQFIMPHLIIKEVLKMLRASIPTTIEILEDIDTDCCAIMADPTQMHQIVMNLCTNALHSMTDEKGTLGICLSYEEIQAKKAKEKAVSAGKFVVLSVIDSGHGMDEQTMARIFEPYFTTKDVGEGTGLGLAVIHGIVRDYHGFVEVESKEGEGTAFHVFIPAHEKEKRRPKKTEETDILPMGTEQILVVDDEIAIVNLNKAILESLGYQVTGVMDSIDALEKIRANPNRFDLVITDQTMPMLTGAELSQAIMQIKPDMPVILCTGFSSVISEEAALAMGIKKYIRKPVHRKMLAQVIRKVLNGN